LIPRQFLMLLPAQVHGFGDVFLGRGAGEGKLFV